RYGADRVFVGEAEGLGRYSPAAYRSIVVDFVSEHGCRVGVFPASALGKDLAPRVAARLGVGYAAGCAARSVEEGRRVGTRPKYAGKLFARVAFDAEPAIVSVRANVFTPREDVRSSEVQMLDVSDAGPQLGAIVREVRAASAGKLDVSEAPIVVSGGRG